MTSRMDEVDARKLAAVVYDDGCSVDAVLRRFARDRADEGHRVRGVIQVRIVGAKRRMALEDVSTGEVIPICGDEASNRSECSFDPHRLLEGRGRVRVAADERADLIIVSRFGREEVAGAGFRPEIAHAVACGCAVLTAVHRRFVDAWLGFTDGVGALIDAGHSLEQWWREARGMEPGSDASRVNRICVQS